MISVSHLHFRPKNMIYPLNCLFQMAGKRYPRAGKRLVGYNLVSFDDIYPYLA